MTPTVKTFSLLPTEEDLSCLHRLQGTIRVSHQADSTPPTSELILTTDDGYSVLLSADYADVTFKFECFGLAAKILPDPLWPRSVDVTEVFDLRSVACLCRFEWERPARLGEVRGDWEQIVRERGQMSSVPGTANAICVSVVGLTLSDAATVVISDDTPATLCILTSRDDTSRFIQSCEIVPLSDMRTWATSVGDWFRRIS